jgi:16S rRNA (adenine1518-N6/adenine1519-N6)-dimethyltransferase
MNKQELKHLKSLYGIKPRKEQGQNFLLDTAVIEQTIAAAELSKDDIVLEIGPGFGALTTALAECTKKVIAVEQDRKLAAAITKLTHQQDNIHIFNEDIRTFHRAEHGLEDMGYSLVANLPYSISSWVFREFLEHAPRPKQLVVMVQKEVGQRLMAHPGKMSVLSVASQLFAQTEVVCHVPPESFSPQPRVDSSVIKMTVHETPLSDDPKALLSLAKSGYVARRKKLSNNLRMRYGVDAQKLNAWLAAADLKENARPQELSVEDWERLRKVIDADDTL